MSERPSIPIEIVESIVAHIGVPYIQRKRPHWESYKPCELEQSLKDLSLVSAELSAVCQRFLFRTLILIFDITVPRQPENAQNTARYERLDAALSRRPTLRQHIRRLQIRLDLDQVTWKGPYLDPAAGNPDDVSAQAALRIMASLDNLELVSATHGLHTGVDEVPSAIQHALAQCIANNAVRELDLRAAAYPVTLLRNVGSGIDSLSLDWMWQPMQHEDHEEGDVCTSVAPRRLRMRLRPYGHEDEAYSPFLSPCTASLFSRVEEMTMVSSEMILDFAHEFLWRTAPTVQRIGMFWRIYCGSGDSYREARHPISQTLQLPRLTALHLGVARRRRGHAREEPDFVFHYLRHPAFQCITTFQLSHQYPWRISPYKDEHPAGPEPLDCGGWDKVDEILADERVVKNLSEVVLEYSDQEDKAAVAYTRRQAEVLLPLTRARLRRFDVRFRKLDW